MNKFVRDHIKELHGYVPGFQANEPQQIKLNANENPYPASPKVQKVLQKFSLERLKLYPHSHSNQLRETIANIYSFENNNIIVGNGSDEILRLLFECFLEKHETLAYFTPSYSLYPILADIHNCKKKDIFLNTNFSISVEKVLEELDGVKAFILTNPNAPTSLGYNKKNIETIAKNFQGIFIIDEAYTDFANDNCLDLVKQYSNVIVIRTLSKSYSLAGIRLGWAIAHKEIIQSLDKIRDSYNVNTLSQIIAQTALEEQKYFKENLQKIITNRHTLTIALEKLSFKVLPSQTNFLFVKPPIAPKTYFEKLKENNIYIRYFNDKYCRDYCRISIGDEKQIQSLLETTKIIINETK